MSLPRYAEYKDSGVEWLGQLPTHWEVVPLKRNARLITERATSKRRAVALENVEGWSGRYLETEGAFEGDGVGFEPGDLLFGKLRPYLAKVLLADFSGEAVGDFHVIRPGVRLTPRFTQYQMLQRAFISIVDGSTFGSKMPRASWEAVGELPFVVPPAGEQVLIASFLDRETAKIDALIAEQEKLLALLAEKRQATIARAVTRGLDPNAPMKDSGIPWLGEVPAHWEVRRLRHAVPGVTVGIVVEPSKHYVDEGIPALRSLNVLPGQIRTEHMVFISSESNELLSKSKLRSGDVVVVRSGQAGAAAVVPAELDGCNCIDLIIIRKPLEGCERFLCWYLASNAAIYQFESGSEGAIQKHFNIGTAMNLVLAWPSLEAQSRIADYLDSEVRDVDALACRASEVIALLTERRSALIAAAVTGKIDVRGAVADRVVA